MKTGVWVGIGHCHTPAPLTTTWLTADFTKKSPQTPNSSAWESERDNAVLLLSPTVEEGLRPDEKDVPTGREQQGSLQERAVGPARARPQESCQAQHRQALDQGANPGWWVLRDPEEEVGGTGEEEGAQISAQMQLVRDEGTTEPLELSPTPAPGMRLQNPLDPSLWRSGPT